MSTQPTEVIKEFLANTAIEKVEAAARRLVAEDATYISLNFDNPELKQILPWTGTSKGPQAFIDTFSRVAKWWTHEDFAVTALFGEGENVAVFGRFTYRSVSLNKAVTSPFSIHAKVRNGKDRVLSVHGGYFRDRSHVQPEGDLDHQNRSEPAGVRGVIAAYDA